MKGFGSIKFQLNYGESFLLHDVMYVSSLMKNLVLVPALEDKGMRVAFIKGKVLTWPIDSPIRDVFTLGLRFKDSIGSLEGLSLHWFMIPII